MTTLTSAARHFTRERHYTRAAYPTTPRGATAEVIGIGPAEWRKLEQAAEERAKAHDADVERFRNTPTAVARFFRDADGVLMLEVAWTGKKDRLSRSATEWDLAQWPEAEAFRAADRKPAAERERG